MKMKVKKFISLISGRKIAKMRIIMKMGNYISRVSVQKRKGEF